MPVEQLLEHFERLWGFKQLAVHYVWEDLRWSNKRGRIPWLQKIVWA